MKISLVDSLYKHLEQGVEYIFPEKSELKPKSKKTEKESDLFNTFLVIFCEGVISPDLKNHLRFFPDNKLIKKNVEDLASFPLHKTFHHNLRYFDKPRFLDLIEDLILIDYALLIQQDPTIEKRNRYALTHFHVKIDWPIADATENLAKWLKYIQSNLHENGDKEARLLQNKLFEYYGCHHNAGGRRTAGLIAAQLLKKMNYISTVFVSSAELRSLIKYSERGVSKFFLIQLSEKQITALAQKEKIDGETFKSLYLYPANAVHVGIAEAIYEHTPYSLPPEEGKIRKFIPGHNWLRLKNELLHPTINSLNASPINYDWVYTTG
jgi:hypothetical protein